MDEKTTMAQGLHSTDDSAGYDAACKRVLSEKAILARIMKACLAEYRDCPVRDIEEKYIEGQPQVSSVPVLPDEEGSVISGLDTEDKSVHEGTVTYDIRFHAIVPGSGEPSCGCWMCCSPTKPARGRSGKYCRTITTFK